jgi:hypothetical protein
MYLFRGHDHCFPYIHSSLIHSVLYWRPCLQSHMSMGMLAIRIEYYYLFLSLVVFLRLDSSDLHLGLLLFEYLL